MSDPINSTKKSNFNQYNKYLQYRADVKKTSDFAANMQAQPSLNPEVQKASMESEQKKVQQSAMEEATNPIPMENTSALNSTNPALNTANTNQTSMSTAASNTPSTRLMDKMKQYEPLIRAAADRYNIDPNWIAGICYQESRFNPRAVSHCGAMGLMQLMPGTASQLGVSNAFDPAQNIDGGAKYLRQMLDKFNGRMDLATAAYNAGPGNVIKHGGIPPFKETQGYVPHVLGYANGYKVAAAFEANSAGSGVRA